MKVRWHEKAANDLRRLDKSIQKRILDFITREQQAPPGLIRRAVPYQGPLKGFHKIRIGDYRLVCQIRKGVLIVLVAHRGKAYKKAAYGKVSKRKAGK